MSLHVGSDDPDWACDNCSNNTCLPSYYKVCYSGEAFAKRTSFYHEITLTRKNAKKDFTNEVFPSLIAEIVSSLGESSSNQCSFAAGVQFK